MPLIDNDSVLMGYANVYGGYILPIKHVAAEYQCDPRELILELGKRAVVHGQECLDHVVVFGERHLRHVLLSYAKYYNEVRTHLSLEKDAPVPRVVERAGHIRCRPVLGGLHHQYFRI